MVQQQTSLWRPTVSSPSVEPDGVSLPVSLQIQVHMLPKGKMDIFYVPFSAKLFADIIVYRPPAHPMFGLLFNIYMTKQ